MKVELIVAGHGGQGVVELANNISYFFLLKGRHVACTPSYGPESRGGRVKCYVVGSDEEIDSPIVEEPDFLIVMNIPSMDFVPLLKHGGTLIYNASLVTAPPERTDITLVGVPANEIAAGLKGLMPEEGRDPMIAANSVMFGAYLFLAEGELADEVRSVRDVFEHFLTERKAGYISINIEAVKAGFEHARVGGSAQMVIEEVAAS